MLSSMTSTTLEPTSVESVATAFSALGDPIRLRILDSLAGGQKCVCELLEEIAIAPNLLSYHLRVLREGGLVGSTRRGRWVDYRLNSDALDALKGAIPVEG
jgi:ArsR family transcriptional regulator